MKNVCMNILYMNTLHPIGIGMKISSRLYNIIFNALYPSTVGVYNTVYDGMFTNAKDNLHVRLNFNLSKEKGIKYHS